MNGLSFWAMQSLIRWLLNICSRRFPDKEEGFLTQTRSKLVNRDNLNHLAIKLGIGEMIISKMSKDNHKSVYGDTLEALIGALYLDKGYERTKKIVLERIIQSDININRLTHYRD